MNTIITWINQKPTGKSMILSTGSKVLPNGIKSIGSEGAFVSLPDVKDKKKFKVGQEIELPDHAIVVPVTFDKGKDTERTIECWKF